MRRLAGAWVFSPTVVPCAHMRALYDVVTRIRARAPDDVKCLSNFWSFGIVFDPFAVLWN
jgi:hypothetical protein